MPSRRRASARRQPSDVALTCAEPPHQATHWTGRAMAEAAGISLSSVQRIWAAHKLQPHRSWPNSTDCPYPPNDSEH